MPGRVNLSVVLFVLQNFFGRVEQITVALYDFWGESQTGLSLR